MENSYGIGVHNRYELLYDIDDDPLTLFKQATKKKPKSAEKENKVRTDKVKTSTTTKETKKVTKSETISKPPDKSNGQVTNQKAYAPRSSERVKFSEREERNNRRNHPEGEVHTQPDGETREGNAPGSEARGRGRGFGRGRGRGRGRGGREAFGDFRGKREFDRQSGMVTSGVKPQDKREGSGAFNWGSDKDQIDESLNQPSDLDTSAEAPEKVEEGSAPAPAEEEQVPKEEGLKEMTLDEWKALQKRDKPQFNIRKPGEGENTAQWKKMYVLKKKDGEEEEDEDGVEYEEEEEEVEIQHGRKKKFLDVEIQFSDSPMRGRGRGRGRGGSRGRGFGFGSGGRGSRYNNPVRQEAPKMDDEHDFPTLG